MPTSLGQLINLLCAELGQAVLDAQHLQIVGISDFVRSVDASDEDFAARYITPRDVTDHAVRQWGFDLFADTAAIDSHFDRLVAADPALAPKAIRGRVRSVDKAALVKRVRRQAIGELIGDRRALLKAVVERNEIPRVHIDSGELAVKLDLSVAEQRRQLSPDMTRVMAKAGMRVPIDAVALSRGKFTPGAPAAQAATPGALEVVAAVVTSETGIHGTEAMLTIRFKTV